MSSKETIFLFPETIQTNVSLFLPQGSQMNYDPIRIFGYKLVCFVDYLDNPNNPFNVVAIKSANNSTNFYQYHIPNKSLSIQKYGLSTISSAHGQIIYMDDDAFINYATKSRYVTIKSGNWASVSANYMTYAAYYHIDVIPQLSLSAFKDQSQIDSLSPLFHKLYDIDQAHVVTLNTLYYEIESLLRFFGYLPSQKSHVESTFCFGAISEAFMNFSKQCFRSYFYCTCPITAAAVKQLRAFFRVVKSSLIKLGYDMGGSDDIYVSSSQALIRFQKDRNIDEKFCGKETLRTIFTELIAKGTDPITTLGSVGVDIRIEPTSDAKFGAVDSPSLDEVGKKFAMGVSRAVAQLPSPACPVASVQTEMAAVIRAGTESMRPMDVAASKVAEHLNSAVRLATDLEVEVTKGHQRVDDANKLISTLDGMNEDVVKKMKDVREKLNQEIRRTTTYFIVLTVLFFIWLYTKFR